MNFTDMLKTVCQSTANHGRIGYAVRRILLATLQEQCHVLISETHLDTLPDLPVGDCEDFSDFLNKMPFEYSYGDFLDIKIPYYRIDIK